MSGNTVPTPTFSLRPAHLARVGQQVVLVVVSLYLAVGLATGVSLSAELWRNGSHVTLHQQAAHEFLTDAGYTRHHGEADHGSGNSKPLVVRAAWGMQLLTASVGTMSEPLDASQLAAATQILIVLMVALRPRRLINSPRPTPLAARPPEHPPHLALVPYAT